MGMTEELTQRERHPEARGNASRPVCSKPPGACIRAADDGGLGAAAFDVFAVLLGAAPDTIRIAHEGGVSRRFGAEDAAEAAEA